MFRKQLLDLLAQPRTASSLARELGLKRGEVEEHLAHLLRSSRAAGHRVIVEAAKCRACGFKFDEKKLTKPGKCPKCRSTWVYEPLISIKSTNP